MNANKFKAVLFIILFLIVVALIVYILAGSSGQEKYQIKEGTLPTVQVGEATATPEVTPTINPSAVISVVTPTPEPTATPTPEPTAEPVPVGQEIASGEFESNTGVALNTVANYKVVTKDDTHVTVSVSVDLEHYALYTIAGRTLNIAVNGEYQTLNVEAISYDGGNQTTTALGTAEFTVDLATGQSVQIPVQIEWHFGGTYGGTEINVVESGGYITLQR